MIQMKDWIFLHSTSIPENDTVESPRLIRIARENVGEPLGIGIIGGNSIGIFISDIQKESLAEKQPGLKCGDKILKVKSYFLLRVYVHVCLYVVSVLRNSVVGVRPTTVGASLVNLAFHPSNIDQVSI